MELFNLYLETFHREKSESGTKSVIRWNSISSSHLRHS